MKPPKELFLRNKRGKPIEKFGGPSELLINLSASELMFTRPVLFFTIVGFIAALILLSIDVWLVDLNENSWKVNLLINLHASVVEFLALGVIVAWYNKHGNRIERIRSLQEDLHSLRPLESEEAVFRKITLLKSLSALSAEGVDLSGSHLMMESGVFLDKLRLHRVILDTARLSNAYLWNSDLRWANLTYTQLNGARLNNANLEGACLGFTNLMGADLSNANLRDANIFGIMIDASTSLEGLQLDGARVDGKDWIDRLKRIGVKGAGDIEQRYCVNDVLEKWYGNVQINHRIKRKAHGS